MSSKQPSQTSSSPQELTPKSTFQRLFPEKTRKQQNLFLFGSFSFLLSTFVTRRALHRKQVATRLPYYNSSILSHHSPLHQFHPPTATPSPFQAQLQSQAANAPAVSPPMEAFEALTLATLNVMSFFMMATGGILWKMDIGSMEDMRRSVRKGLGVDERGGWESDKDEEIEEWVASMLSRKEEKEKTRAQQGKEEKK
ncbi:MAG: hypothetical protein M1834_003484 [Cirrosporium novae-zelandiae]|nr:MAG: hypothetical protein M1834_003484 [Cirrosporium novae-zelandiae]